MITTEKPPKNILVCLRNKCQKCKLDSKEVSSDCPYSILHLLETNIAGFEGGIQEKPRQSGKTFALVQIANAIADEGGIVYLVTINQDMVSYITTTRHIHFGVKVISLGTIRSGCCNGFSNNYVLCDELVPEEIEYVMREMRGSVLVAAYYTGR